MGSPRRAGTLPRVLLRHMGFVARPKDPARRPCRHPRAHRDAHAAAFTASRHPVKSASMSCRGERPPVTSLRQPSIAATRAEPICASVWGPAAQVRPCWTSAPPAYHRRPLLGSATEDGDGRHCHMALPWRTGAALGPGCAERLLHRSELHRVPIHPKARLSPAVGSQCLNTLRLASHDLFRCSLALS